jgi:hypothetical protein
MDVRRHIRNLRRGHPAMLSLDEALLLLVARLSVADSGLAAGSPRAVDPPSTAMRRLLEAKVPMPSGPYPWQNKELVGRAPKQLNFECPLPANARFQFCLKQVMSMDSSMAQGKFLVHIVEEYTNRMLKALGIPIDPPD